MNRSFPQRSRTTRMSGLFLAIALVALFFTPQVSVLRTFPDVLRLSADRAETLQIPWLYTLTSNDEDIVVRSSQDERLADVIVGAESPKKSTSLTLNLLGLLPIKSVDVQVTADRILVPGGQSIGVSMYTKGVLVVNTSEVTEIGGRLKSPARDGGLLPGDVILQADGRTVNDGEALTDAIMNRATDSVQLLVLRKGKEIALSLTPVRGETDERELIGAWVRATTAGVGTLSFYDPATGRFGALGHAIADSDTGSILLVREGHIFSSHVVDIRQGQRGDPGELKGSFDYKNEQAQIGNIDRNNNFGIYGDSAQTISNPLYPDGLPIARQDQIHEGPARILTTVDESGVQAFDVNIVHITRQSAASPKSMVLEVTDPKLLSKTGGIVQGMSGSPIIQDGRIIGAVTHVYINDPTRGYGLFIEWMLQQGGVDAQ